MERLTVGTGRLELVRLAHGGGGLLTRELVGRVFLKHLGNPVLDRLEDAAVLPGRLALTTDAFVVSPLFFPGGDIGRLAVCGTVNDLAMVGARPLALTASFILEEGLPLADLEQVVASMAAAAREAGVTVVAGDTKVVERGGADGLFVTTAGVGLVPEGIALGTDRIRPGDRVVVSGPVGDHGIAVLSRRPGLEFDTPVLSDCRPLNGLVAHLFARLAQGVGTSAVRFLRDPTRGGLATVLKEAAEGASVDIVLEEEEIPVRPEVRGAAEVLGLDPLYLANEGKLVAVCAPEGVEEVLAALRERPEGREARAIGRVEAGRGNVILRTAFGGRKILDLLPGEQLPRIC